MSSVLSDPRVSRVRNGYDVDRGDLVYQVRPVRGGWAIFYAGQLVVGMAGQRGQGKYRTAAAAVTVVLNAPARRQP